MELTSQQTDAIASGQAVPVAVNETECVILRKDLFERVRHLIYDDGDLTRDEMQNLIAAIGMEAGWNEPEMDAYDNYDEELARRCP
jgi:hypothetical protein